MTRWLYISIFLLTGCASQKVVSFVNEEAAFSKYNTYALVNYKLGNSGVTQDPSGIYETIESNIISEMSMRGYTKNNQKPDILARYEIISNQRTNVSVTNPYSYSIPIVNTRTFLESTLLVELTDFEKKKLIWQASIDMNQYANGRNHLEAINEAVSRLFQEYLYTAGNADPNPALKND